MKNKIKKACDKYEGWLILVTFTLLLIAIVDRYF